MSSDTPQPFGILPASLPPITTPTSVPTPTSYIYVLPTIRTFNHIVVFLLPGITLPPNTAAAVYLLIPPNPSVAGAGASPDFKFLGGIGEGKESAIFKISGLVGDVPAGSTNGPMPEITIGVSVESAEEVAAKMAALPASSTAAGGGGGGTSQAVVPRTGAAAGAAPSHEQTIKLAQRIIKNAFNFLASFSGNMENGVEVVPLKAFEGWWRKFEGKVVNDPGFLSKEED